ncbi:MAG: hypothetical protein UV12_C0002G0037 [Candidatus Nomurabacteria bacterium GW2011_GWC2_42_20]|uniref:Uncharacterized protein n=1 Tax=Candidatus Nomurabacteria bacterium GW2011_GWC2_42_20 TaxID=1618756 RepID=A0A0G1CF59_9BACT|nr:MAG: hypothetical protein UV12_C0002G0037 [Candidatus Nomurabacteria bacterium GW2011_GWC2_42_20]
MKNIIQALKVVALALILSFGISYVYAWTAPTMTPPNGNVSAPINTSSTAQTKSGGLTVGSITAPSHCIGASCITSWPTGGGVTPPAGSEFLNTSATAQTKAGWLKAVGGNGGDLASRIGVGNNWWMSENTNGNYAIHRNGVGDKLTMDTSGNVVLAGGLTAAGLNTAGTVTASGNIQGWSGCLFHIPRIWTMVIPVPRFKNSIPYGNKIRRLPRLRWTSILYRVGWDREPCWTTNADN